jgi:hypothetical protein
MQPTSIGSKHCTYCTIHKQNTYYFVSDPDAPHNEEFFVTKKEKKHAPTTTEVPRSPEQNQTFKIWDSRSYIEEALENPQTIQTKLSPDLITLWHEYSAYLSEKKYDQESRFGLNGEYGVPVSQICRNFEHALEIRGKDTHRAALETWVAESYEHFKNNDSYPVGSLLVSISPRGGSEKEGLDEGYPGLDPKNYVFINVFIKTAANRILPRQFMSYALTSDLKELQQNILQNPLLFSPHEYTQVPLPQSFHTAKAKSLPTRNEHEVIGKLIAIPCTEQDTDSQLQVIRDATYEDQSNWKIKLDELPQIDPTLFDQEAEKVLALCTTTFQELLGDVHQGFSNLAAANENFNVLVTDFRNYLLKWVEINSANYNSQSSKSKTAGTLELSREAVLEAWKIKRKKKTGVALTKQQHSFVQQTSQTSSALSPLFAQISSGMQCIILSPVSAPLSISKQVASMGQTGLISPTAQFGSLAGATAPNGSMFAALSSYKEMQSSEGASNRNDEISKSISEKKQLLSHYQSLQHSLKPITVTNSYSGQTEIIYAWFTDESYLSAYDGHCYRKTKNGPILGPCDISLEFDDLLVDFQVPGLESQSIQTKKTNSAGGFAFLENWQMQAVQQQIFELEMELLLLTQLQESLQNETGGLQTLSEEDSGRISRIVDMVSKKIFRITLSDLIAGVTEYSDQVTSLPKKCLEFLEKSGNNKIQAFYELLLILETEDISNILRVLREPFHIDEDQTEPNQEEPPQMAFNQAA